jgi:hypothetical protein
MEIVPRRLKPYFDGLSFDGQLQRSVGKADCGMANVREGLAIARQITPGDRDSWCEPDPVRAAEYFRQAFFSAATTWTGASFVCRAGWTRCCRARQCERVEQAEADWIDRR